MVSVGPVPVILKGSFPTRDYSSVSMNFLVYIEIYRELSIRAYAHQNKRFLYCKYQQKMLKLGSGIYIYAHKI